MQINYHNGVGFALRGERSNVALCLEPKQVNGEQVIISNTEGAIKASNNQVVFDWPGEYEAHGVSVMIIPVGKEQKGQITKLILDDFAIAHLDSIAERLTEAEEEKIGNIDILFVSIGKNAKLSAKDIQNTIEAIDPKLVIPMNFSDGEEKDFAKNLGHDALEPTDNLKLKKSDLPNDRMDLKILKAK